MKLSLKAKKPVIFLFSIIGSLAKKPFWEDLPVSAKFYAKAAEVVAKTEELATMLNLEGKDFDILKKDIKRGIYSVEVFHDEEIREKTKQIRKMPVKMQKEHRDDLIEIVLQNCCDCKRNIKHCDQRKLFKKMSIEAYDPDKAESKCEYWYKGVR